MRYTYKKSYLEKKDGIEYIYIKADNYYQSGYICGELFKRSHNRILKLLKNPLAVVIFSFLYWFLKKDFQKIRIPEDYLEELKGYACSSGISYRILFFINFIFDVLKRFGFHCSSFVFFGSTNTFIGRNTDLRPFLAKIAIKFCSPTVVTLDLKDKIQFTHVTIPFFVGAINGINVFGIAVNSHQMLYVRERKVVGNFATPLLVRLVLENAKSLSAVEKLVNKNITARSLNLLVSDLIRKDSCIIEIAPDKTNVIKNKGKNYLACTTHFQSSIMNSYHYHSIVPSIARLNSINNYLEGGAHIDISDIIKLLKDTTNGLKNDGSGYSLTNFGTFQSFIFDFYNNYLYINNADQIPVTGYGQYIKLKLWTGEKK